MPLNIPNFFRYRLRRFNPTLFPPLSYTRKRARQVYGDAFRRAFEYLRWTGVQGDVLEFGTFAGYTARILCTLVKRHGFKGRVCLFDSFEGFPEIASPTDQGSYETAVNKVWVRGALALHAGIEEDIRRVLNRIIGRDRLHIVKGYFEDTLPAFKGETRAALVHLDCDLYASTRTVLVALASKELFQDGCVLMFDDYNCNRANPAMGQRRALAEFLDSQERYRVSPWFSYGWHGQSFFLHDLKPAQPSRLAS